MSIIGYLFIGVIVLTVLIGIAMSMTLSTVRYPSWFVPPQHKTEDETQGNE